VRKNQGWRLGDEGRVHFPSIAALVRHFTAIPITASAGGEVCTLRLDGGTFGMGEAEGVGETPERMGGPAAPLGEYDDSCQAAPVMSANDDTIALAPLPNGARLPPPIHDTAAPPAAASAVPWGRLDSRA